jgi:hypothetical protein
MQTTQSYTSHDDRPREDHVVFLSGVSWKD